MGGWMDGWIEAGLRIAYSNHEFALLFANSVNNEVTWQEEVSWKV